MKLRKILLIGGGIVLLLAIGISLQVYFSQTETKLGEVPKNLELKASKEKIIAAEDKEGIKIYRYISDIESTPQEIVEKGKIVKESSRTKNGIIFDLGENKKRALIFADNEPFVKYNGKWMWTAVATTTPDVFDEQISWFRRLLLPKKVYATNFNAEAGDGWSCYYNGGTENWATVRGAATGNCGNSTVTPMNDGASGGVGTWLTGADMVNDRIFFPFDTNAISDAATITAATLNFFVTSTQNAQTASFTLVQTSQASETALVADDYNNFTYTEGTDTRWAFSDFSTKTYYSITLNATGRGWIKKSGAASNCGVTAGWTCLGMITSLDADNTAPTGFNVATITASESATNKPYLDVTYTEPGGTTPRRRFVPVI